MSVDLEDEDETAAFAGGLLLGPPAGLEGPLRPSFVVEEVLKAVPWLTRAYRRFCAVVTQFRTAGAVLKEAQDVLTLVEFQMAALLNYTVGGNDTDHLNTLRSELMGVLKTTEESLEPQLPTPRACRLFCFGLSGPVKYDSSCCCRCCWRLGKADAAVLDSLRTKLKGIELDTVGGQAMRVRHDARSILGFVPRLSPEDVSVG